MSSLLSASLEYMIFMLLALTLPCANKERYEGPRILERSAISGQREIHSGASEASREERRGMEWRGNTWSRFNGEMMDYELCSNPSMRDKERE